MVILTLSDQETYLHLANELLHQRPTEVNLPASVATLPALHQSLFDQLSQLSTTVALIKPAYAYAIMAVTNAAAQRGDDLFLRAQTALQLTSAANSWVQPRWVETAVSEAQALFSQLQDPGWLAVCTWQRNAIPWTRPNFPQVVTELEQALKGLELADFTAYIPECQLSLAYAYLLVGRFDDAERETAVAQQTFESSNNFFGMGRCFYTRASYLRRQTHFEQASDCFTEAQRCFQQAGATLWHSITTAQLGLTSWYWRHDAQTAESNLKYAIEQFKALDVDLWLAQSYLGLGQMYRQLGQLPTAAKAIQSAREIFSRFHIPGLLADTLLDSGWLDLYLGNYQTSLDHFQHAEMLYGEVGNSWLPVIATMHQGEAYVYMGQYQQALQYLEKASHRLETLAMPQRKAWCHMQLAQVHAELNHWTKVEFHLNQAEHNYQLSGQMDQSSHIFNLLAKLRYAQGKREETLQFLRLAIASAERHGEQPEAAQSYRLLGHILCKMHRYNEAFDYLQTADSSFVEMGMILDQAACQVELGDCYRQINDQAQAQSCWEHALSLIASAAPELEWRAYFGLAQIAEASGDGLKALNHYHRAVQAVVRLRRTIWQPSVAGSYLSRPATLFDRAIALAANLKAIDELLYMIEESKAQTTVNQLAETLSAAVSMPKKAVNLVVEIRWLQQQIRDSSKNGGGKLWAEQKLHHQFIQKVRQYDELISQLERAQKPKNQIEGFEGEFDLVYFRQKATEFLGVHWLALDFYQNENEFTAVAITPTHNFFWTTSITPALNFALDQCSKTGPRRLLLHRDLTVLGEALLPKEIVAQLTIDTHLLIVPNKKLHRLPWAALPVDEQGSSLVTSCIPTVVPSLQSLLALWQRPQAKSKKLALPGLLIAVTHFQERHHPLVNVEQEIDVLVELFGGQVESLINAEAIVENWRQLQQEADRSRFGFLYIATHAFSDQVTGRLSGIALHDRDLWLDELKQFAPLPPLVTLSTCSGLRNFIHDGDEQIGLTISCLAAGAQRVVGSLWPILDESSPSFMRDFCQGLLDGYGAAEALVRAQRTAVYTGTDIMHWASFQCIGQP